MTLTSGGDAPKRARTRTRRRRRHLFFVCVVFFQILGENVRQIEQKMGAFFPIKRRFIQMLGEKMFN
jgi:hypothetical protein